MLVEPCGEDGEAFGIERRAEFPVFGALKRIATFAPRRRRASSLRVGNQDLL